MTTAAGEAALEALIAGLGIAPFRHAHRPVFTVEEGRDVSAPIPGLHTKNLFLKDRDGTLHLVTCEADRRFRIRDLDRALGAKRTSFGKPDLLRETLGVAPGAVTPLAVVNDAALRVRVALDAQMMRAERVNVHPLRNDATWGLAPAALLRILRATGREPVEIDMDAVEAASAA